MYKKAIQNNLSKLYMCNFNQCDLCFRTFNDASSNVESLNKNIIASKNEEYIPSESPQRNYYSFFYGIFYSMYESNTVITFLFNAIWIKLIIHILSLFA